MSGIQKNPELIEPDGWKKISEETEKELCNGKEDNNE